MASSTMATEMNSILNPFLFQIIGSTPSGIKESIKKANLRGNASVGVKLATACVFGAAVNKVTLEDFITKPAIMDARATIQTSFSISGKTNMTAMTLLGHCLLTSSTLDSVEFVKEFRLKMGQHDLWAGDFSTGSLSDKQKTIYVEKKRVTKIEDAKLLGSGYFKYVGVDRTAWTTDELTFWDIEFTAAPRKPAATTGSQAGPKTSSSSSFSKGKAPEFTQARPSGTPARTFAPPAPGLSPTTSEPTVLGELKASNMIEVKLSDGNIVDADAAAVNFYLGRDGSSEASLVSSIERSGIDDWNRRYGAYAVGGAQAAATTIGA